MRSNTKLHGLFFIKISLAALFFSLVITSVTKAQELPIIALTVGNIDATQYGRNYGIDNATVRLDATFTPIGSNDYTFSWQTYDTEVFEMELFLNDGLIQSIPRTSNNRLGAIDQITISQANLLAGENTFSFRVTGGDETWGVTNLLVEEELPTPEPPISCTFPCPSPSTGAPLYATAGDIVAQFNGDYGNAYGGVKTFNLSYPLLFSDIQIDETNYNSTDVARDVVLRFTEKRGLSNPAGLVFHVSNIFINGVLASQTQASFGEFQREVIINRNLLSAGQNIVKFVSHHSSNPLTGGTYTWGVKDLQIEYLPKIALQRNRADINEYGSAQSPTRLTGLRATVELRATDKVKLLVSASDIDITDELEAFVNGKSVGFLSVSTNNQFNEGDSIDLEAANLKDGENEIELVLRRPGTGWSGTEDEKWKVKDLQIMLESPTMVPMIMLLLDED